MFDKDIEEYSESNSYNQNKVKKPQNKSNKKIVVTKIEETG